MNLQSNQMSVVVKMVFALMKFFRMVNLIETPQLGKTK